jgi:hypothetical protein
MRHLLYITAGILGIVGFFTTVQFHPTLDVTEADAASTVSTVCTAGSGDNTMNHPSAFTVTYVFSTATSSTAPALAGTSSSKITSITGPVASTDVGTDAAGGFASGAVAFDGADGDASVQTKSPKIRHDKQCGTLTTPEGVLTVLQDTANAAAIQIFVTAVRGTGTATTAVGTTATNIATAANNVRMDSTKKVEMSWGNPTTMDADSGEFDIRVDRPTGAAAGGASRSLTFASTVAEDAA